MLSGGRWIDLTFYDREIGYTPVDLRTPVYMSFMRGIGGIVLGAGIGALCMVLIELWQCLLKKAAAAAKERK